MAAEISNFIGRKGQRVKLGHHAKFRSERSNRCWDIVIFRFFKDGGCPPSWLCVARVSAKNVGLNDDLNDNTAWWSERS